jgi:hypothetical protein
MDRVTATHALCIYAEPLAAGGRVIVVGDATQKLGERLLELGARTVHVYDPDRQRARAVAAEPARGVSVRELPSSDFDVRDGAFDLAIVPDLALVADPATLLTRLRRLVGPEGAALVCAAREGPASVGYYELYDLVSMQFASVRMIGQVPFVGVAIAELGESDDEAEVSVDTQLVDEPAPPEIFIALASERDVRLESFAVIQLPDEPVAAREDVELAAMRARFAEAQLRADLLQTHLDTETSSLKMRLREAEAQAKESEFRAQRLAEGAGALEVLAADRLEQCAALSAEVEATREAARVALAAVEERDGLVLRLERAEQRSEVLESELAGISEAHAREIAGLEDALRDRGRLLQELEEEAQRRDRIARDLLAALEEGQAEAAQGPTPGVDGDLQGENDELRAKLDALALDLARRQGDLEATSWRLKELEHALTVAKGGGERLGESERKIAALLDELDVVKQALAQEHAARSLAESRARGAGAEGGASLSPSDASDVNDELARARAELQRQEALIEQLSRERRAT